MKRAIYMTVKLATVTIAATLVACGGGGGGGGGDGASVPTPVLTPGIWNKPDNATSQIKFIGVVTTSASGGEVWSVTEDSISGASKMFTGAVSASGESFATNQGTVLTFSGTTGWSQPASAQSLTLPKSTSVNQRVFQFLGNENYTTQLDPLWATDAKLNDVNDWNDTWTLTESVTNPISPGEKLEVTYSWAVSSRGEITGTKSIPGLPPCEVLGDVTPLEKAVVRVSVKYNCAGVESTFAGISYPLAANNVGKVSLRSVWLKGPGTSSNQFVIQQFSRSTP